MAIYYSTASNPRHFGYRKSVNIIAIGLNVLTFPEKNQTPLTPLPSHQPSINPSTLSPTRLSFHPAPPCTACSAMQWSAVQCSAVRFTPVKPLWNLCLSEWKVEDRRNVDVGRNGVPQECADKGGERGRSGGRSSGRRRRLDPCFSRRDRANGANGASERA